MEDERLKQFNLERDKQIKLLVLRYFRDVDKKPKTVSEFLIWAKGEPDYVKSSEKYYRSVYDKVAEEESVMKYRGRPPLLANGPARVVTDGTSLETNTAVEHGSDHEGETTVAAIQVQTHVAVEPEPTERPRPSVEKFELELSAMCSGLNEYELETFAGVLEDITLYPDVLAVAVAYVDKRLAELAPFTYAPLKEQ